MNRIPRTKRAAIVLHAEDGLMNWQLRQLLRHQCPPRGLRRGVKAESSSRRSLEGGLRTRNGSHSFMDDRLQRRALWHRLHRKMKLGGVDLAARFGSPLKLRLAHPPREAGHLGPEGRWQLMGKMYRRNRPRSQGRRKCVPVANFRRMCLRL